MPAISRSSVTYCKSRTYSDLSERLTRITIIFGEVWPFSNALAPAGCKISKSMGNILNMSDCLTLRSELSAGKKATHKKMQRITRYICGYYGHSLSFTENLACFLHTEKPAVTLKLQ